MARKPVFKHPDLYPLDLWREWVRKVMPTGQEGFVIEDTDQVIRNFEPKGDQTGRFILIETKYGCNSIWRLGTAQCKTFGLIDKVLRMGDPERKRYLGFYVIQAPYPNLVDCNYFLVNGVRLDVEQYKRFMLFEIEIPTYDFGLINV